jgi:predicted phosphoribosyltransferase
MDNVHEDYSKHDLKGVFKDRTDAGVQLADMLLELSDSGAMIFALPPGGVPVGVEIARLLHLRMDAAAVWEIYSPNDPQLIIGVVGPDETLIIDDALASSKGLSEDLYRSAVEQARQSVLWRDELYRQGEPYPNLEGKTVILVDEGVAEPIGLLALIKFARSKNARKVVVAVPTATARALEILAEKADEVYCLNVRTQGDFSVSEAYREWREVDERDAMLALRSMVEDA